MKKIIFVCTGNVCRSVMSEMIFKRLMKGRKNISISSAGIEAKSHYRIEGRLAPIMRKLGVNPKRHRSKQLTVKDIKEADCIIVMERRHKEFIEEMVPLSGPKVFLIKEFGGDGDELHDPIFEINPDYLTLSKTIEKHLKAFIKEKKI